MVGMIESIRTNFDYGRAQVSKFTTKLVETPSAREKVATLFLKIIAAANYLADPIQNTRVIEQLEGFDTISNLFNLLTTLNFWIDPFNVKRINQKDFILSLEQSLSNHTRIQAPQAGTIVQKVMSQTNDFKIQKDAFNALKKSLSEYGYREEEIDAIIKDVRIATKPTQITGLITATSFTISGIGGALKTLNNWGTIHLEQIASQIGSKAPIFAFVTQVSLTSVIRSAAGVGLITVVIAAAYRAGKNQYKILHTEDQNKIEKYRSKRNQALWTFAGSGLSLTAMTLPLILPVGTPVIIGLQILSTSIGLVRIFVKP